MNIVLDSNLLTVKGIDREGNFFVVEDNIGFSTGDGVQGFNNFNTSFKDSVGVPYPKVDELALVLLAYYNSGSGVKLVTPTGYSVEPTLTQVCTNYDDVRRKFIFPIESDGWYTIYSMAIPTDVTKPTHYDKVSNLIVDNGTVISPQQALLLSNVQSTSLDNLFTPHIELELSDRIGKLADIGLIKGKNSPEFHDTFRAISYVETMLIGAKVKFEEGEKSISQTLVESVLNSNPYEFC
jgi:hypothetical protein